MNICDPHSFGVPQIPEEDIGYPRTIVTYDGEMLHKYGRSKPVSSGRDSSVTEPSLQHP